MIRTIGEPLVLFMIPFGLYVGVLLAQLINPFELSRWTKRVVLPLACTGALLAVGGLFVFGLTAERHAGGYAPAHLENGRLVPGEMR